MIQNQIPKSTLIPSNLPEKEGVYSELSQTINSLTTSLKAIAPTNSETTQLITYTLIATAVVGIFVYHYIKNQEE